MNNRFHQQNVLVMGVLGGIAFTALVLVIQSKSDFYKSAIGFSSPHYYLAFLMTSLAVVSFLSIMSSVISMAILTYPEGDLVSLSWFGRLLFKLSIVGFGYLMPLLIYPFSIVGASVVFALDFAVLTIYGGILRFKRRGPPAKNPQPKSKVDKGKEPPK